MAEALCARYDIQIAIESGDLQVGLKKSNALSKCGAKVFISRGGTAQLLKKELKFPVIDIRVTAYDLLEAFSRVDLKNNKIGIIGFENVIYGAEKLGRILDIDLSVFIIQNESQVSACLREAVRLGIDTIVGDKVVVTQALRRGLKCVLVESCRESLLQAVYEAQKVYDALKVESELNSRNLETFNQLNTVLDSVEDQIVILDSKNRISSCNAAALAIFKKPVDRVKGRPLFAYPIAPLEESLKTSKPIREHLSLIGEHRALLDYLPIETGGNRTGTVIIGKFAHKLEQAEWKVRKELYLKGHVARYIFGDIRTQDQNFKDTIQRARCFARSKSTILISGETGTGKELIAQSIHNEHKGQDSPFVALNCATLPEPLLESELFGYAPGAFTGAGKKRKKGYFELAHCGTLMLDEIGELPLSLQSRLLRVIEERVVQPIGDERVIPVDVRIIAATNRDLINEVRQQRFRADLFYRLNILNLKIPPLRERGRDPFFLFKTFVLRINPRCNHKTVFSPGVKKVLCQYHWPGNIRELKNLVERLSILTDAFNRMPSDFEGLLNGELQKYREIDTGRMDLEPATLNLKAFERAMVQRLCESGRFTQQDLAKLLGVSRTTLWKIRKTT